MDTTTLSIPTSRAAELQVRVDKFNKRAVKLGMEKLGFSTGTPEVRRVLDWDNRWVNIEFTPVTIVGEIPALGGWKICAVIDHLTEGGLIIRSVSREALPEIYRTRPAICDHCQTKRPTRKTTFVLKNKETGEYKQVGKSCLKDFVKVSVEQELAYLTSYFNLITEINEKDYEFGKEDRRVDTFEAFSVAANLITSYGFVSTQCETKIPTKYLMYTYYYDRGEEAKELDDGLVLSLSEANKKAQSVVDWIKNSSDNSEFFFNLKTIADREYIDPKYFGYIAGAVSSYLNTESKKVAAKETINNEYLDIPVGKRVVMENVSVKHITTMSGFYGTTWMHKMVDANNHVLVWFSSSNPLTEAWETANPINIKATVKAYQEYNGIKQTVLNRVAQV